MKTVTSIIIMTITALAGYYGIHSIAKSKSDPTSAVTASTSSHTSTNSPSPSPPSAAAPAALLGHSYGIAAGGSLIGLSQSAMDNKVSGIAATGAKWIRFDFNWSLIQPNNSSSYQWSQYDQLVSISQKYHLQILGIIDFTPGWARSSACSGSDKCMPANFGQFASFAGAVASRYKSKGLHYWEIWNEPNSRDFWQPAADPVQYANLLAQASSTIRKQDSQALILTGGLAPESTGGGYYAPIDFLSAIYKAGAKSSFDAVADHPYTFPVDPITNVDHAWTQMAATQLSLRALMIANGDSNKKIWITEYGAPTNGPDSSWYVSEATQSKLLSDSLSLYKSYDWVGPYFWYSYQDVGTSNDTNENFFGLLRYDGSKKPAYTIFQQAANGQ